jgi:TATA-binding protein-associated factor Taf7
MRQASVTVAGQELNSVLVDLPCIVECQKTLDNITLFKSGDISQACIGVLVVQDRTQKRRRGGLASP